MLVNYTVVHVSYQWLQTQDNNENHEAVGRVIFIVFEFW